MVSPGSERVGRYQLLEPIGIGPSGMVSRAKVFGVAGFERQFAVKRFHTELTSTAAMAQALSTAARAYGSLEHPRIARMSEFGVAQGVTFTAVELVAGLDVLRLVSEARLAGMTLAAGGTLTLVSQTARAVGYAHGRGLSHLGLAPTNVIVTPDGDVKITDFGVLSAGLPARPVDVPRLANRIAYLAPEQIAGEATSAATDVFSLGVIAYELVTGHRAYPGSSPAAVATAITSGPPPELPLPRPIVRVLQRCLARSPFERFPDARALADALDAALRVAPVPGTRKDIGAQVKETMDRLASLNESGGSGVVALNVGTGPVRRLEPREISAPPPSFGAAEATMDLPTHEFVRPETEVPGPAALVGPATTMPDMIRAPLATMPGLAPPPIPVPHGVHAPSQPMATMLGIPPVMPITRAAKPGIPAIRPFVPAVPTVVPQIKQRPPTQPPNPPMRPPTGPPPIPTMGRVPTKDLDQLPRPAIAQFRPDGLADVVRESAPMLPEPPQPSEFGDEPSMPAIEMEVDYPTSPGMAVAPRERPISVIEPIAPIAPAVVEPPIPLPAPLYPTPMPMPAVIPAPVPVPVPVPVEADKKRSMVPWVVGGVLAVGVLGFVGWQVYDVMSDDGAPPPSPRKHPVIALADAAPMPDAAAVVVVAAKDAATVAIAKPDAGAPVAIDAAIAVDAAVTASAPVDAAPTAVVKSGDSLVIDSLPHGAHVFLDGSDQGVTPAKLAGSTDHHSLALLLAGHDLYTASVDGHGTFTITLKEVTPPGGPAGIKVIKCKDPNRYYVYVDGKATGMMCPTERIETSVGAHTVEVYDANTEQRKKFDINVTDTRLSYRVRVE